MARRCGSPSASNGSPGSPCTGRSVTTAPAPFALTSGSSPRSTILVASERERGGPMISDEVISLGARVQPARGRATGRACGHVRRRHPHLGQRSTVARTGWRAASRRSGVARRPLRHHRPAEQRGVRGGVCRLLEARGHPPAGVVAAAGRGAGCDRRARRPRDSSSATEPGEVAGHACVGVEALVDEAEDDRPLPDRVSPAWKAPTSGGSTGRPKLIVSGRPGLVNWLELAFWRLDDATTALMPGPLYHNGPFASAFNAPHGGRPSGAAPALRRAAHARGRSRRTGRRGSTSCPR